jgi:RNA polymerase sigma-70 factor (ECF subfamily)
MTATGGSKSVQQLVDDHYSVLYRYAFRLAGGQEDASDLVQETFLKAQAQLAQLRDSSRARSWLFTILRNCYLQRLRSNKNHREVTLDDAMMVSTNPSPPSEISSAELQKALSELPESFRTPVILFFFEEFSYRDIAEQLDLPMGTVMSRLARAKAYLRRRLS